MRRNLRWQLTVAFALVSLLVLSLLAGVGLWFGRQTYLSLKADLVKQEIVSNVRTHYQLHGTLEGLAPQEKPPGETSASPVAASPPALPPVERGSTPGVPPFIVLDSAYQVVAETAGYPRGTVIPAAQRVGLTPIAVRDKVVAYLLPTGTPPQLDAASRTFLTRSTVALVLITLLAVLLASALGAALSRQVLEPLQALRRGVRTLTHGQHPQPLPDAPSAELAELSRAFNTMSAELERRRIASQQFSADIAHELGTPLGIMRGTLEAMQDGTLPVTPERLTRLQGQVLYVMHVAADLRLLSLADAGDLKLNHQAIRVDRLLDDLNSAFQAQVQAAGLTLEVRSVPLNFQADPVRLTQIMNNLIQNALNHTPSGGTITLRAQQPHPAMLEISVQDTGTGIPDAQLPFVFDRLYRSDTSRSKPGSGLGLSISRMLAEAHGGTLELSSVEGYGTTATLKLPNELLSGVPPAVQT